METKHRLEMEKKQKSRTNLFNQSMIQKKKKAGEDVKVVSQRLIVIARLHHRSADRTELGAHYEKLNFELSKQHIVDEITGLLLIYPSCLLHVIESSGDILTSVLEDLKVLQQQPDRGLLEAKILFMAHNIENRLFEEWSYKVLDEDQVVGSVGVRGYEEDDEKTEHLFCSVLSILQKLAEHLERPPKALPELVLDETPGLIIPQRTLEKLLHRDEFMSPEQYLHLYKSPLNINTGFGHLTARSLLSFT
uniref:Chromosome 7 open reading frame 62 n=1 Tax=Iconisemion striatum TaxID=60296 RepID=A0A1A7WA77_9TELE